MTGTVFDYQVRDQSGKIIKGRIEAESAGAVVAKLKGMGLAPLSVAPVGGGLNREVKIPGFGQRVKLKDLAVMSRQLATMIDAGLPLLRSLSILEAQTSNKALAEVIGSVRVDVQTGGSFSGALAKHPNTFPPLMIHMIRAGEVGGFLDKVLVQVARNFEADVKLRSKVKSAMTYPIVILVFAVLALVAMLIFIVPVFAEMFRQLGGELPMPTQVLVTLSNLLRNGILFILVAIIVLIVVWRRVKYRPQVREFVDRAKLRMPVFGQLFQKISISRFSRNLGTMVHAGVPILQSLDIVSETAGNVVVGAAVRDVRESVRRGDSLARPLAKHPVFPPMTVQMMSVGEDTGELDTMLHKIAEFYDSEVEATTEALTSLIEPLMIIIVGGMVGGMLIALYLPIFKVFELVK